MKILFVNEKCGYFGGVEQNVADCTALRQRGHHCALAWGELTGRNDDSFRALFDETVPCRELGAGAAETVSTLLGRLRPDVVYLHKVPSVTPWLDAAAALGDARPTLVRMVHDHDLCCPRRHKYYAWNGRICDHRADWRCYVDGAFLQRGASGIEVASIGRKLAEMRRNFELDALLVNSRFMGRQLELNGCPASKIKLRHPCVRPAAEPASPAPDGRRVLYVGQLIRGKGVELLLSALTQVPQAEVDIVGDGNAREGLCEQARTLGLAERVRFHGFVDSVSLAAFYHRANVVVVPSRWPEPFGMVGLEAMKWARPVVAFRVGGIVDWLVDQETGLLVDEQDTGALAAAINRLLADRELARRYGTRGREVVEQAFSFDGYLDHLEQVLSESAKGLSLPENVSLSAGRV
jgi:glycosyltransferase involved in cell wall biosynthesis